MNPNFLKVTTAHIINLNDIKRVQVIGFRNTIIWKFMFKDGEILNLDNDEILIASLNYLKNGLGCP